MSTITATVSAGHIFSEDANDLIQLTKDTLNSLGLPSVAVDVTDAIALADLTSSATVGMPKATLSVGNESADAIAVTLQVLDGKGNNLAEKCVVDVWLADTAGGAKTATAPDGGLAVTDGAQIDAFTATTHVRVITDATGKATLTYTHSGGLLTKYVNAKVNDKYIAGSQALSWAV